MRSARVLGILVFFVVAGCGDPYKEGVKLIEEGDYENAAHYFHAQMKKHPDDPRAYHQLGFCYARLELYREAGLMYSKALQLKPDYFEAELNLGTLLLLDHKLDSAAWHLEKAVALRPDCEDCHVNLAWVYYRMNRFDQASQHIGKAVELSGGEREYLDVIEVFKKRRKEFEAAVERNKAQALEAGKVGDEKAADDDSSGDESAPEGAAVEGDAPGESKTEESGAEDSPSQGAAE
jgi:Flp pilus assembly protein TadD